MTEEGDMPLDEAVIEQTSALIQIAEMTEELYKRIDALTMRVEWLETAHRELDNTIAAYMIEMSNAANS